MSVKKSTIAGIAAACGVVAVLGGGYVASLVSYPAMIDQARVKVQEQLNAYFVDPVSGEPAKFSVDFSEPKFGIWNHELTLVVVNDEDFSKLRIPLTISTNYMGYDFNFDLVHATVNDEYVMQAYDFSTLTALQSSASYSMWSDELKFALKASYLNDLESFAEFAAHTKAINWFFEEQEKKLAQEQAADVADAVGAADADAAGAADAEASGAADTAEAAPILPEQRAQMIADKRESLKTEILQQLKDQNIAKDVGTLDIQVSVDPEENVKVSLMADSVVVANMAYQDLRLFSNYHGLHNFTAFDRADLSLDKIAIVNGDGYSLSQDVVLKTESSRVTKQGKFNLPFTLDIGSVEQISDYHTSGEVQNLNLKIFNEPHFLWSFAHYIEENPVTITFDKGSSFKLNTQLRADKYAKPVATAIPVTFSGSMGTMIETLPLSVIQGETQEQPDAISGAAQNTSDPESVPTVLKNPVFYSDFTLDVAANVQHIDDEQFVDLVPYFIVKGDKSTSHVRFELNDGELKAIVNGEEL